MTELKSILLDLENRFKQIRVKLNPETLEKQIRELEAKSSHPDFWSERSLPRKL